jgi:hypothetical protein
VGKQLAVTVPMHAPPVVAHASPVVHAIPSSQAVPAASGITANECVASLHAPVGAHGLLGGGVGTLERTQPFASAVGPGEHVSTPVHQRPSSQIELVATCVGAPLVQLSVVHAMPSLGTTVVSVAWAQPVTASHESIVHGLPSSQLTLVPPPHVPAVHVLPVRQTVVEHALPSTSMVYVQPLEVGVSIVHGLWSSQTGV